MIEQSAGVILFYLDQSRNISVLLVRQRDKHWGIPKGHIEQGESLETTALRELREETGVEEVSLLSDHTIVEEYIYKRNGIPTPKRVIYFVGITQTTVLRKRSKKFIREVPIVQWVSYTEALSTLTYRDSRKILEDAYRYLLTHLQK